MPIVPVQTTAKIEFYENHVTPWNANAVAIGTTVAAVTDLDTKTQAARAAFNAQQAAQQAAKSTTIDLKLAMAAMADAGADIIKQIRAQGAIVGDSVYSLAEIPAPAIPSPKPPPGTAYQLSVLLNGDGSLNLGWRCDNPPGTSGTIYQIFRQVGGTGDFTYLGGVGEKRFVDETVPGGASFVTYKIQAVRSTAVGMWNTFNVQFGTNAGGMMTAMVTSSGEQQAPKLAA